MFDRETDDCRVQMPAASTVIVLKQYGSDALCVDIERLSARFDDRGQPEPDTELAEENSAF